MCLQVFCFNTLFLFNVFTLRSISSQVWNPSFDVTPAELIAGIITEVGMVPKQSSRQFDVSKILESQSNEHLTNGHAASSSESSIPGFYALDLESVKDYLASRPDLCKRLGDCDSKDEWQV